MSKVQAVDLSVHLRGQRFDNSVLVKRILIILFFIPLFSQGGQLKFVYLGDSINIEYDQGVVINASVAANDKSIMAFFKALEHTQHKDVIVQLLEYKKNYQLNDWLYFDFVKCFLTALLKGKNENYQIAYCWYVLNKSNLNVNLRYLGGKLDLYTYSDEKIFLPYYKVEDKKFFYLQYAETRSQPSQSVRYLKFFPNKKGDSFSFRMLELPLLKKPETITKTIAYSVLGKSDSINVVLNKSIISVMNSYPPLNNDEYFKTPLSATAANTLFPELRSRINGLTKEDAIRYLLSFVRTGFKYREYFEVYGKDRPMIAEEVLFYAESDCEDKSNLFGLLVHELVGVHALVLMYPNHINIGVALDKAIGKPFKYKGNEYSVCEPSVLGDSKEAGIGFSRVYESNDNPKVIFEY